MDGKHILELALEISRHNACLADEATHPQGSRAMCEAYAGRLLKAAARIYGATLLRPNEGIPNAGGAAAGSSEATARPATPPAPKAANADQLSYGAGGQPAVADETEAMPTPGRDMQVLTMTCRRCRTSYPGGAATCDWCGQRTEPVLDVVCAVFTGQAA